ncbi:alpha/beta hydrolase [Neobacillus drentensis]|jgi:alpha-beta hydrolase superfamily lysophospholipase|uniref:alpha/beta hydrolase n=1 Tax=Neobacillus drentensis TaxID=220684 RepID=UPI003000C572
MSNIDFIYDWTKDGLRLQGIHWEEKTMGTCVLFIHGTSGNIIENYFAHTLGRELSNNGYGFFYGHNRGYSHINDIKNNQGNHSRIGARYEKFSECLYDIDLWVNKIIELGYEKIIIMGHSLGANKTIYYNSKEQNQNIVGLILGSPPDLVGLTKLKDQFRNEMINEARDNLKKNEPNKILSHLHEGWFEVSSETYLEFSIDGCAADNLPILRNPDRFEELDKIKVPILAFMGDTDEVNINSPEEDLLLLKTKATNCPDFQYKILDGANHNYIDKEKELSDLVVSWIKQAFK